jgi:hypothetical protein
MNALLQQLISDPDFYINIEEFFKLYIVITTKKYLTVSDEERLAINTFLNNYIDKHFQDETWTRQTSFQISQLINQGFMHPIVLKYILNNWKEMISNTQASRL